VSTRKLIVAALVCGIAILLAGGVFLITLARHKDDFTVRDVYRLGESATLDGTVVTVQGWRREADSMIATVKVASSTAAEPIDVSAPWTLLVGTRVARRAVPDGCDGRTVAPGATVTCQLGFAPATGTPFLAFALGRRQVQWRLEG
jgi:hypothetical protein